MKMSIIIDKCFLLDNHTTNSLSLQSGHDTMHFNLHSTHSIIRNLSCDILYKFWLKKVDDQSYTIFKIEELIDNEIDEDDYPEPDESDTDEIKASLLHKIDEAIVLKKKTLSQLENIQKKLSEKKVPIKSMEEAYNELNECI